MIESRIHKILKILSTSHTWTTVFELATKMNVTKRTIITDINEINYMYKELIQSSSKGYKLDHSKLKEYNIPFSKGLSDRDQIIYTALQSDSSLNVWDLCESLFISYSTIRSLIKEISVYLKPYDLDLEMSGDILDIKGDEVNKRRVLKDLLMNEADNSLMSYDFIQSLFPSLDITPILPEIEQHANQNNYFINDYSKMNLILHLAIAIERIQNNYRLYDDIEERIEDHEILSFTNELMDEIELIYDITISTFERIQVDTLIQSKITSNTYRYDNYILDISDDSAKIIKLVDIFMNDTFSLNFNTSTSYIPFVLHIKNLIQRINNNQFSTNEMMGNIKHTHPLIYNTAVNIAEIINSVLNTWIPEPEIGFLALHIGALLESDSLLGKLMTLVIYPQYVQLENDLPSRIEKKFEDSIIIDTVSKNTLLVDNHENYDLIISTVPLATMHHYTLISPFFDNADQLAIYNDISIIQNRLKLKQFESSLRQLSDETMFSYTESANTKLNILKYISDTLFDEDYVDNSFYDDVIQREEASATFFNHIAIPHTFSASAKKSCMYIYLSKKPIEWSKDSYTNIVLLFAINEADRKQFYDVFELVSTVFSEYSMIHEALRNNTYSSFVDFLLKAYIF